MGLQKIWPLGAIRSWLSNRARGYHRPDRVTFRGVTIYLDPGDSLELSVWGDEWDGAEVECALRFLRPGDAVIDIGANIGALSLVFARAVGEAGRVYAFEPEAANLALLKKNVKANRFEEIVSIVPKAVGPRAGVVRLYLSDYNPGDHRVYDPEMAMQHHGLQGERYDKIRSRYRQSVEVPCVTIDGFFAEAQERRKMRLLKMDVQGAEGGVLMGARRLLERNEDLVILMEFWPAGMRMFGTSAEECLSLFKETRYLIHELDIRDGGIRITDAPELMAKYTVENSKTAYLVCARKKIV